MTKNTLRDQWPDALMFLAQALKAGLQVDAAIDLLSLEAPPLLRHHLKNTWLENKWRPASERIELLLPDPSLALAKAALLLSYETGGTVAPVLEKAAGLLKTKMDMAERARTMTIQGTASAWVVGLSPFLLAGGFSIFSADYIKPLVTTRIGLCLFAAVVLMNSAGLYFVHRAARVDD